MPLQTTDLIPRAVLFGNPERGGCQISPCGRWLAFAAPHQGVMNIWVTDWDADSAKALASARPLTNDRHRGVYSFSWAYDGVHLLYLQDKDGDENEHLYAAPVAGGPVRDLTPFEDARASITAQSRRLRDSVLVSINNRDPRFSDLYRLDLGSGELTLVRENPGFFGFVVDEDYGVRLALAPQPDGSIDILVPEAESWKVWRKIAEGDAPNTWPQALSTDGRTLYMLDSRGRDTAALVQYDIEGDADQGVLIAGHPTADITGVWTDIVTHEPLAWTATYERREIHVLDERIVGDVEFLDRRGLGQWGVASRTDDDSVWIIGASTDVSPTTYYSYVRATKTLAKLYDVRPALAGAPLARMQSTTIPSRDGLNMVSYLTLPVHADAPTASLSSTEPLPLVLLVHGGPHARDSWGYDPQHQWLANRGYAVLSVNYRASTGFGKAFLQAGDGEWGRKMDEDLIDAVEWAIARGVADPNRICVMGASYGGYATLWAMSAHPERFACGVDIVGPSNLETLAASIPPYWESAKSQLFRMIGNADTEEGRMLMKARSPVHKAGKIRRPLLIGQGANDPRVKQAESDQMVAAMKANGVPVTYVLFPDEGHGFQRPANNIQFNALTEAFLEKYLGGRREPVGAGEVDGNTAVLVEDALN
ncbi:S9 family peptidase [Caulobacter radicis]|uniref:S9 family peptidase n=1 Tax=Caulobacter radicis TaxID=2172650 RepID=UPI000D56B3A6|nr:S9 family peptidase [Caulobacter radicis]PVM84469.1 S9 family peptidase [Caulobacter radicis]